MANGFKQLRQRWLRWAWITPRYMKRLPLIPRNRWLNIFLHRYTGPDWRDEGLHDHPWDSISIRLWGEYLFEYRPSSAIELREDHAMPWPTRVRVLPRFVHRRAEDAHAIAHGDWPVWTLFITFRRRRNWGFYTKDGWRPANEVIAARNYSDAAQ